MKKLLLLPFSLLCFFCLQAQLQVDKQIQLTGSGSDAKVTGIKQVSALDDAVNVQTLQENALVFATSTGSANAYAVTLSPSGTGYTTGMVVHFIANFSNTSAATLSVNGGSNKTIKKNYNTDLAANDIKSGQAVSVMYDGTNFQMLSQTGSSSALAASNGVNTTNGDVELGGALTKNTDIPLSTNNLTFSGAGNVGIGASSANTTLDVNGGLSMRASSASLTANNTIIGVGNTSYLQLSSNGTATNRIFYLSAGSQTGQRLLIENISALTSSGPNQAKLLTDATFSGSAKCHLNCSNMIFTSTYSNIELVWNGSVWNEITRSASGNKAIFAYTGSDQTWTVPSGVTQIFVKLWGAGGGGNLHNGTTICYGGGGAFLSGALTVTPGQTAKIIVGQGGRASGVTTYGGGGKGVSGGSSSGGGRSAIQIPSGTEVVTAGGGGAAGFPNTPGWGNGGAGGATTGTTGIQGNSSSCPDGGAGGTASSGGAGGASCSGGSYVGGSGSQFTGGDVSANTNSFGGGGGGGYYGGGAGGNYNGGGGGGGSSYYAGGFTLASNVPGTTIAGGTAGVPYAGGNTDIDYQNDAGLGGTSFCTATACNANGGVPGGHGLVIIYW